MTEILNESKTKELLKVIVALKDKNEAGKFFRDLLTERELVEFGNRWRAAKMLSDNIPYVEIEKETKLSSATIARISKWLKRGMGGYKLMLKKMHHGRDSFGKGLR